MPTTAMPAVSTAASHRQWTAASRSQNGPHHARHQKSRHCPPPQAQVRALSLFKIRGEEQQRKASASNGQTPLIVQKDRLRRRL
jgi:hypothetical protein